MRFPTLVAALIIALAGAAFATGSDDFCAITFTVTREYNGKPVRNASIVLHPVDKNGKQKPNGVELKADNDGKASYPALPYGKVRVQVLAPGLQTYGQDYEIKDKTLDIEVKLKRPQEQYSIYDDKNKKTEKEKEPSKDPKR
jgi:hypothetical protein